MEKVTIHWVSCRQMSAVDNWQITAFSVLPAGENAVTLKGRFVDTVLLTLYAGVFRFGDLEYSQRIMVKLMIGLIQRVSQASVTVAGEVTGQIAGGLLVLLGVEKADDEIRAQRLCERVLGYRVFHDEAGKMNVNVQQAGGALLVVSQFTLVADTGQGLRPGFSRGAPPEQAKRLYEYFVDCCRQRGVSTQTGQFAAVMQVALVNDGPVTFWLQA